MDPAISIGKKKVGMGYPVYIIAEMSANHNKDFQTAVNLIYAAKDAGADAIKVNVPGSLKENVEKFSNRNTPIKETFLVITTSDGNTFKGRLIEKNIDYVALETSIGRIDVKKEKITKVTEQE